MGPGGGQGADQRGAGPVLHGERAGCGGRGEPGVGEGEAQRVHMPDEPGIDERDALTRRDGGQQGAGPIGAGGGPDVEAERPQISVERGSGCRMGR